MRWARRWRTSINVDARLMALAIVCQLVGSACHARAWGNLLQAARPESLFPRGGVLCAHLAAVAGNAVVPAHAGDSAKVCSHPPPRTRHADRHDRDHARDADGHRRRPRRRRAPATAGTPLGPAAPSHPRPGIPAAGWASPSRPARYLAAAQARGRARPCPRRRRAALEPSPVPCARP